MRFRQFRSWWIHASRHQRVTTVLWLIALAVLCVWITVPVGGGA